MTAQILVVDDVPANVKLLEAKLAGEYYDVLTAKDGHEAIKVAQEKKPDLILLDVMMPGIDGFETCKRMKKDESISHIPVVMVTALSEQADRVRGLDSGADDFLTKPINDMALFARVKSLVRIKVLLDELRLRDKTSAQMGVDTAHSFTADITGARVMLVDDDPVQAKQINAKLEGTVHVTWVQDPSQATQKAVSGSYDLILVSAMLTDEDGLRLASKIKSVDELRHVPIIVMVDEDDAKMMVKVLEVGFNDYLRVPVEKNEMIARIKTQIRRKRYQDALRSNYQQSVSMAITDALTGLYNRHYLNTHLENMVKQAQGDRKPLGLLIMDMDHFKQVNDTHGHDSGDAVLKQLGEIIVNTSRSTDLVARFGGEEFVVLMPDTAFPAQREAGERMRQKVEAREFKLPNGQTIKKTVSIGVSYLKLNVPDSPADLIKRADEALYMAKNGGRNKVHTCDDVTEAAAKAAQQ